MNKNSVAAIYQHGIIKPQAPLSLRENEIVTLCFHRQAEGSYSVESLNEFSALRGIWSGLGDPSCEDIEAITHQVIEERLTSHLASFEKRDP